MLVELQIATDFSSLPSTEDFQMWCTDVLTHLGLDTQVELTIRITSSDELQQLNRDYRGKDEPTNILSFPFEAIPVNLMDLLSAYAGDVAQLDTPPPLGDLVISPEILNIEAKSQGKCFNHHFCHITIHGMLHLLGYNHIKDKDAIVMEKLEIEILKELGIANPYK
ncbi:MAG: rRNA maturation RNase YbeY [Ostreibacterium sp.]